ncbi:hypothetical protein LOZ80_25875 [Paenibacillus sp. HWE-109]|uniref:hypothetical protein n=1 Tax=Paenibacillus sp. HWE-109 TaxID=1306526 RepID=UPI001EDEED85|nr:hypothetical protein [Paenibacillus sp. HWE-109]UKS25010.1 hypothetical protein LOZ80_25875 [Paenibacillus sp. HWE-109]
MDPNTIKVKATAQHKQVAQDFISTLYNGTVEEFSDMLADSCQASVYTVYEYFIKPNSSLNDYDGFHDFLENTVREENRAIFSSVKTRCGVAEMARYDSDGEVSIYLVENTLKVIHFISPVEASGGAIPVRMVVNMKYDPASQTYSPCWKIRITGNEYKTAI